MTRNLIFAIAIGCSAHVPSAQQARFANKPPATVVDDRRDVPAPPKSTLALEAPYGYNTAFEDKVRRRMELPIHGRARGVNSIDEVPDSTWFTNRGSLTAEQVRNGPLTTDSPELHFPWTVESTKSGGASVGFLFTDARGVKFVLKFDDIAHPEIETGTDVVVDRLLWACGYNVPEDHVVYLHEGDLVLAANAVDTNQWGETIGALDHAKVVQKLRKVAREPDGRIRALASRWLDGTPIGPPATHGVREDDPNDLIPHEERRDQRGMYPIYAWLDMVDLWPGNFLDVWVADPADRTRHYVKHYMLDFGRSLGVMATKSGDLRRGFTYRVDWPTIFGSLFSAGIVQWSWENRPLVDIPGVAPLFTATGFEAGKWHPDLPYRPFDVKDRYDGLWGARIVSRFTREQIRAAVEAGRFSDPRAVDYITNTLVTRQRETASYWFGKASPLDRFTLDDGLCFDDLAVAQGLSEGATTHYEVTTQDAGGHAQGGVATVAASLDGHACVHAMQPNDGYTIYEVTTVRPGTRQLVYVHVDREHGEAPRVIGVIRS